ncbi:MAG: SUMF1/EgtB/PvdO family nonheme iron enzyme, partial [Thiotrichales bacterium]
AQGKGVGPYSDIYSLGIVFYEMLTGKAPYAADTPLALALKHVTESVPKLSGDLAVYQPLLDRMMAKSREARYPDCDQIIADLERLEAGKSTGHVTDFLSTDAVNKAKADADNLSIVEDFPSIDAGEPVVQATEILNTAASSTAGSAEYQKTEILTTAAGAGAATAQATEILRPAAVDKGHATAGNSSKVAGKNTAKAKEQKLTLVEKNPQPDTRSKASAATIKSLLWAALGLLIAGGVYAVVDVDMGKLKTLAGIDPGPVYSRVGRLITVPEGSFKMGNAGGASAEKPVHTVRNKGFRLGETEVTQKQWRLVMGSNPSYFKACDDCPVDSVSWNDVQKFIKKLNQQTGLRFRLPTEAEWEYACRSTGRNEKFCGGNDESALAWYGDNSGAKTHPVAQKQDNDLGLHDMSGNVWEWTQDCWHDSYQGAPTDGQARDRGACKQRTLRGGSWIDVAGNLSSTGRFGSSAATGNRNFGFRVAQDI